MNRNQQEPDFFICCYLTCDNLFVRNLVCGNFKSMWQSNQGKRRLRVFTVRQQGRALVENSAL